MTLHTSPEPTPADPGRPNRRTVMMLAILLGVGLPLITVTLIWPAYGTTCAVAVAVTVAVLQILREHRRK